MVSRILNFFGKEWRNVHEAAFLIGGLAFFSQILGLVRDRLFAHTFGASSSIDIYYAAFRLPDLLYVSIASFVSVTVLIPFLMERLAPGTPEADASARRFLSEAFSVFFFVIVAASAALFVAMPYVARYVVPGFSGEELAAFVELSRILLLSPILIGISNLVGSVTQVFRNFSVYALSPILYNSGIILGILFLYPSFGLSGLAMGVILGAFLHLAVQLPLLARRGFLPLFTFRIEWADVKRVVLVSLPRTLTLSFNQISLLILIGIASLLGEGAVSVFNFAYNLQNVPLILIGVSYSVAAFPGLIGSFAKGDRSAFSEEIRAVARIIIFWSVPATFLFIVLRAQLVRTLLGSGAFSWSDTKLTAAMLALFALSMVAQGLILLLIRGYYAMGNTRKPLLANVAAFLVTVGTPFFLIDFIRDHPAFAGFLEVLFRVEGAYYPEVLALPLAYTLGMLVNATLLIILFEREVVPGLVRALSRTFFETVAASFFMGFTAYQFLAAFGSIFDINTFVGIFLQGLFAGLLGIAVGILFLTLMKNQELAAVAASLKSRFWRTPAIAPEQGEL